MKKKNKYWYRLDTAALIFPAVARQDWSNGFRLSATLHETIDPVMLQQATNDLKKRFPSYYVSLHKGFFWYYLEESEENVCVQKDYAYPLTFMSRQELRHHCLRVLYYQNRIAVEFFHSLTDGRGGSVYLCNLVSHYLELKHGISMEKGNLLRELHESVPDEELEDSFLKHAAPVASKREKESTYHLHGTKESGGFKYLTTGILDTQALLEMARSYHVSITAFLAAVMAQSVMEIQDQERHGKRQRPVKITIPVDLRRLYDSQTLRNFSLVLNVGVDPRLGTYSLEQLCLTAYHQLCAYATPQYMAGMIAANVQPQQVTVLRLAPVFLKNIVMNAVYNQSGERGGCLNISNLSEVSLPDQMRTYVDRMEFIIGPQRSYPNNCSVLSYNGKTYINMIRNIRESELERRFFSHLVELGLGVEIENNRR